MPASERLPAGEGAAACFHCGDPVRAGERFCCLGCEAVSTAILRGGLGDYYRLREKPAGKRDASAECDPALFDDPRVQSTFVREARAGILEAELVVEGMRCAACAWLVEQAIRRVPGVEAAHVTFATRRASVRWEAAGTKPSAILAAARDVGHSLWPYDEKRLAQVADRERRSSLARLWVAGLAMMQVMMYALPGYVAAEGEVGLDADRLMRWAGLVLTAPVMVYCAQPIFRSALRDLAAARLGVDVPVALGLAVAFAASAAATVTGAGAVYFDSVTMFVFLLLGGRHLEMLARARAAGALGHLARLVPQMAARLRDGAGLETEAVPVALLEPGDRVLVRPGETLPADGVLESARAAVAEALLSGESRPVARRAGDRLLAGTVNAAAAIVVRVTRAGAHTALASIARLTQRALAERPRWAELAERMSPFFTALVLGAALAAAIAWSAIDPPRALWIAVSVLIVTCPCALSLATPVALTVATGEAARGGFIVARGRALEALAGATDVVFDKTGTLTLGRASLVEVIELGRLGASACVAMAAAMARASSHPLDHALAAAGAGLDLPRVDSHVAVAGAGAEALVNGRRVRIGKATFAGALHGAAAPIATVGIVDGGHTPFVWLADEDGWLAVFRLADDLRPGAGAAVERLRASGAALHLLTGDEPAAARAVARPLGIENVEARATPQRKIAYVRELQALGRRVALVGDGINDAPALAQADLSIAMGGGADLAQVHADAVLLADSLADLAAARALAVRTRAVIRQNLAWALAYNALAIPLAVAGAVTPLVAGLGMSASSLAVVLNALRLRRAAR
jgi:Cu2+-exporting ATPase